MDLIFFILSMILSRELIWCVILCVISLIVFFKCRRSMKLRIRKSVMLLFSSVRLSFVVRRRRGGRLRKWRGLGRRRLGRSVRRLW